MRREGSFSSLFSAMLFFDWQAQMIASFSMCVLGKAGKRRGRWIQEVMRTEGDRGRQREKGQKRKEEKKEKEKK